MDSVPVCILRVTKLAQRWYSSITIEGEVNIKTKYGGEKRTSVLLFPIHWCPDWSESKWRLFQETVISGNIINITCSENGYINWISTVDGLDTEFFIVEEERGEEEEEEMTGSFSLEKALINTPTTATTTTTSTTSTKQDLSNLISFDGPARKKNYSLNPHYDGDVIMSVKFENTKYTLSLTGRQMPLFMLQECVENMLSVAPSDLALHAISQELEKRRRK
jgi:hypothetical protein